MDKYIIFGLLIVMALLLIIHLNRNNNVSEKFTNPELPNLQSCPASLNKYASDASINCCDGSVVENKCQGEAVCTLGEKTDTLPRCIEWYKTYLDRMSKRHCPSYLKNFYEDEQLKKIGFCTSSPLNKKLRAPLRPDDDKCNIHKTNEENLRDPNSCLVKKMMDKMLLPTEMSPKSAILVLPNAPVVLTAKYLDTDMHPLDCIDRPSADAALDVVMPGWRNNTEFKNQFYINQRFCDDVKRKLDAFKEDPNYRSPLTNFNVTQSKRFSVKAPKFKWSFNWKWPKMKGPNINWKPKQFGVCKK